jgi:2-succinyl-6-hydroxy-2,4-cyclohexadiene-1-carboxylate synthase
LAPTVVLLHGFTHTGASWDPVARALPETYRALSPDIRGHGRASHAQPVSLEVVIDDVGQLAPDRFTLAGYSMGGRIALHVALALPERIDRLVLIGASPGIADPGEREQRRRADEQLARELQEMDIEAFAERWARTPVLAGLPENVQAAVDADRRRSTPDGLAKALRHLGTGALPPLWTRLGELTMPVVLVAGERDLKFSKLAGRMAQEIPAAEVVIVPGAGHAAHLEAPEELARVVDGRRPRR